MGHIGNTAQTAFTSFDKQTITGDGTAVYTLSHSVANEQEIEVFVNNVRQEGGSGKAYTVSGNQITFSENIASTDTVYVNFAGKAVQTVTHPSDAPLQATTGTFSSNVDVGGSLLVDTIKEGTGTNTAMTIDSSGNVNIPNKLTVGTIPAVFAQGSNNNNKSVESGDRIGATNDGQAAFLTDGTGGSFIQGGMTYDSATGTFTVPVAGLYYIMGQYYLNENNTARIQCYINDTAVSLGHNHGNGGTPRTECIQNLSANDEIEFRQDTGSTRTIYEGQNHTLVSIYLVG
jgi:hypothetical protein